MNKVSTYRSKANLSQRSLAALVGVSQQTIQRIETGSVTVRHETALALASALKVKVSALFPEMQDRATAPQPITASDFSVPCSLNMAFSGNIMRTYHVDEATAARVGSALTAGKEFVVFDTKTHEVAVNTRKILWAQTLMYDAGNMDMDADGHYGSLEIYFDGSAAPQTFKVNPDVQAQDLFEDEDIGQLEALFYELDVLGDGAGILSFDDEDGETVHFNPALMAALEVSLAAKNPKLHADISAQEDQEA